MECVIELPIINVEDWVAVLVGLVNLLDGAWEPDDCVPHPGENKCCAHHKRTSLKLSKEFIHFSSSCVKLGKHLQAQSLKLCIQRPTSPLLCTVGGRDCQGRRSAWTTSPITLGSRLLKRAFSVCLAPTPSLQQTPISLCKCLSSTPNEIIPWPFTIIVKA